MTGLFSDRASVERACRALAERGYREDAIKLLISDQTCSRQFRDFSINRDAAHETGATTRDSSPDSGRDCGRAGAPSAGERAVLTGGYARDAARHGAPASHRPATCPATVSVAVCADPHAPDAMPGIGSLADALAGSRIPEERMAEYEAALRAGAILMRVIARSADDARLIEIEWRRSYRAEKVHS